MYYVNYFFIFSMLGHFLEVFFFNNGKSGILYSYWTPIYGIGVVIILLLYNRIKKWNTSNFSKLLTLFLYSSIILCTIEAFGGYLIKWIFNTEIWNCENHLFNIGRYTSLIMAFIWGTSSIIVIYIFKPIVDKFVFKIPRIFSLVLITMFILDLIATLTFKT